MKDREMWALILIAASLVIRELWILIPTDYQTYQMFPYSDISITKQTYWSYPLRFASEMLWTAALFLFFQTFKSFLHVLFLVQFVELIEYFYTYNEPWFETVVFGLEIPVGITVSKFIVLTVTTSILCINSYHTRS